jgi:HlyD family secretion protein
MSALGNPGFSPAPGPPVPAVAPPPASAAPPPSSKSWIWYLAGALAIAGAAGWMLLGRQGAGQQAASQTQVKTAKVTVGPLVQTVRVSGLTASRAFVNVVAPIMRGPEAGREMSLLFLIQSGSRVKKGDLVAQIDAKTVEDHVDDIGDDIEQADADIRRRKAEQAVDLENLNQTIRAAKAEYEKAALEAKALEVRTEVERELLQLTVEETAARYKQVQADTQQKLAGYAAEIRILGITRDRHVRHRERHRIDLVKFKIIAPMDGLAVVQSMFRGGEMSLIQQGDAVTAGQLFMKVVDPTRMVIEGNINQTESNGFRLGQKADIRFDAYPAMHLRGHVDSIAALATRGWRENFFIRNLPVRVLITGSDPNLIPDLSASADVVTGQVDNAKVIPLGAIQNENGKEVVFVRAANGRFDKRAVEFGARNNTHAAVKSGLEAGEEVAVERPTEAPAATASL